MKNLIFAILLISCINISAQERTEKPQVFVRVFDLQGHKINMGKILSISDTLLQLRNDRWLYVRIKPVNIAFYDIGKIKTKRSAGHNVLIGATIVAVPAALLTPAMLAAGAYSLIIGEFIGAVGIVVAPFVGLSILTKESKSYIINGDALQWKAFKEAITINSE